MSTAGDPIIHPHPEAVQQSTKKTHRKGSFLWLNKYRLVLIKKYIELNLFDFFFFLQ